MVTEPTGPARQFKQQTPQEAIDEFWSNFTTKSHGKVTTVVPQNQYAAKVARNSARASSSSSIATQASYDDAAAICKSKVEQIVKECRRINKRYRDPHFDLEADLKLGRRHCLDSLRNLANEETPKAGSGLKPQGAKRVVDIFDKPCFFIDGPTANDVKQGSDGDCWLMAALCTLSNKNGLIEKLCVAHDQDVGVYGFVFHRDGEWISEIVDDFLYLTKADFDEIFLDRIALDEVERTNPEEAYRRLYQSNSTALYFAQCQHPQETWLPLLEKCYAKAHGDYAAIEGGFGGEGIEDLTGGVASELYTADILDKEYFWKEELLKVNEEFLFGCSTGVWGVNWGEKKGIVELHAYSIQKAVEIDGRRLVRLKNPWGKGEWKGAWSDGSSEWSAEWLEKLDHRFGDDGDFWIAYEDLLRKYQAFERTRLFGADWRVSQLWTSLRVPWTLDYHDTYFSFTISKPGPVVMVLAQLDDRYFRGLEGQYRLELAFRLHKAGQEDYLVRSQAPYRMRRSVNVELELEGGEYDVRVKVTAVRLEKYLPIETVIRDNAKTHREKLTRIGLAYDLAHGKGTVAETEDERAAREAYEKQAEEKERRDVKKKILESREEAHYLATKKYRRDQMKRLREAQKEMAKESRNGRNGEAVPEVVSERGPTDLSRATNGSKHVDTGMTEEALKADEGAYDTHLGNDNGQTDHLASYIQTNPDYHGTPHESEWRSEDTLSDPESLSELSERELNIHIQSYRSQPSTNPAEPPADKSDPDEFEKNPWNAVAVVGLRIYYKVAEQDRNTEIVRIKVVRPNPYIDADDGDAKQDSKKNKGRGLDVDDAAKDATLEGDVKERKMSIVGDGRVAQVA